MPLMLLGEFCGERRGGEPVDPHDLPRQTEKKVFRWGASGVGQSGCCQGGDTKRTLTFGSPSMSPDPGRKKEYYSVSSVEGPPNPSIQIPHYFCTENVPSWQYLSLGIFLWV